VQWVLRNDNVGGDQDLPMSVLELALRSEELQLASENDAYALVGGWVASRPEEEQIRVFRRLVKCLRLHHMTPAFLTSVVCRSEYREGCPYLLEACANAFMYKSITGCLHRLGDSERSEYVDSGKADRAQHVSRYDFTVRLELAECLKINENANKVVSMRLGIAEGFILKLEASKEMKADGGASMGLYLYVIRPNVLDDVRGDDDATVSYTGPMMQVHIMAHGKRSTTAHLFKEAECGWGFPEPAPEALG
jgi:hypothetical protein